LPTYVSRQNLNFKIHLTVKWTNFIGHTKNPSIINKNNPTVNHAGKAYRLQIPQPAFLYKVKTSIQAILRLICTCAKQLALRIYPGNTKGEVSLYFRPLVWLLWNQLYDNWQLTIFFVLIAKQTIQTGQTGGQLYSDTFPFSVPWFIFFNFW